jgi:hypothetical protein
MSQPEIPPDTSPLGIAVARQVLAVVVQYPNFERITRAAVSDVNLMLEIKMPAGIIILSESGMGKTLLLDLIRRNLTSSENFLAKARPTLSIALDSAVDPHKLAAKVMFSLGFPMLPSKPNLENMTQMVDTAMERLRPKALLIDESQHMCEGNRDITATAVTDWLKVRMDKHNLPIICDGTHTFNRIYKINPQFVSRASAQYSIEAFEFGDAWLQLIKAFVAEIKLINVGCLETQPFLKLVHTITRGNLRRLKKLLVFSSINCTNRSSLELSKEDIQAGFDRAFGVGSGQERIFPERPK